MKKKPKVLMAMSGGLDSSIASILLKQQGYEVIGATYRTWDYITESCLSKHTGCCSIDAIQEAKSFAEFHGFEHHILDFRTEFKKIVIQNFVDEYFSGNTPNPCVICNSEIKWGLMLDTADKLECEYVATGHYAGIGSFENRFFLVNSTDTSKDQTYFLWRLTSEQLSRTLFPLYNLKKSEVRKLAEDFGFSTLAKKRESQEICFIPNNDYREFISVEFPEIIKTIKPGPIYDMKGNVVGQHKGYINYTIGQRKGLGIALGEPVYITKINSEENSITIGKYSDLATYSMKVKNYVINKYFTIPDGFNADVKIRYNTKKVPALIKKVDDYLEIQFEQVVYAVTPGQSAVFYIQEELIGGGIIF